jgi:NADH-quinone oxidoreductase subunit J
MCNITIDFILLLATLLVALWSVMTIRLLRGIIGLALTSIMVTIIMFRLNAPLAAVFELSVCAGLISVIFITTVSFTRRVSMERLIERRKERISKFWELPVILILAAIVLWQVKWPLNFALPVPLLDNAGANSTNVQSVLWHIRHLDLLGQIIILLAGALGVVILFKEHKK